MLARTVMKNVIYNSSSLLIANLTGLIVVIFLARTLKPELFGIYTLSLSIIYIFSIFADLGINSAITRYIADAVAKNDYNLAGGYFRFLFKFKLSLTLAIAAIVAVSPNFLSQIFDKPIMEPLLLLSIFLVFSSMNSLFLGIANAMNDFRLNLLSNMISGTTKLFFTFLLVLVGLSLFGALLAIVFSAVLTLVFAVYYVLKRYQSLFVAKRSVEKSRVLRFVAFTAVLSVTWVVFANVDIVMIGYFLRAEDVAFYRAGFSIVSAIAGLISIPAVLLPVFVKLEDEDLSKAFSRAFKYSSALCIPSAFGVATIAKNLLLLAYGVDYIQGLNAMRILSLLLISPIFGIYGAIFSSKEKPELNFYPLTFSMGLNVALNWILIPIYSIDGAAIATVFSNVVFWILLAVICAREFAIFPKLEFIAKPLFCAIVMGFVAMNFDSMLFSIPISILVYSALMFLVKGITKEDVAFIRAIARV
ncbi:MAG: flippase [Archaeoglobaceae archaeon]